MEVQFFSNTCPPNWYRWKNRVLGWPTCPPIRGGPNVVLDFCWAIYWKKGENKYKLFRMSIEPKCDDWLSFYISLVHTSNCNCYINNLVKKLCSFQACLWACGRGDVSTPSFGGHLNPISTRGADYAHPIYWCPHQLLKATGALEKEGISYVFWGSWPPPLWCF